MSSSLADLNLEQARFSAKEEIKPWLQDCLFKYKGIHVVIERSDANKIIFRCKNNSKKEIIESKSAKSQIRRQTTCPFKIRANNSFKNKIWSLVVMNSDHDHEIDFPGATPSHSKSQPSHLNGHTSNRQSSHPNAVLVNGNLANSHSANITHSIPLNAHRSSIPTDDRRVHDYGALEYPMIHPNPPQPFFPEHQFPPYQMMPYVQVPPDPHYHPMRLPHSLPEEHTYDKKQSTEFNHPKGADIFSHFMGSARSLSPIPLSENLTPRKREMLDVTSISSDGYFPAPRKRNSSLMLNGSRNSSLSLSKDTSRSNSITKGHFATKSQDDVASYLRKDVNNLIASSILLNESLSKKGKLEWLDSFTSQFIVDHTDSFSPQFLAAIHPKTGPVPASSPRHDNMSSILKTKSKEGESEQKFYYGGDNNDYTTNGVADNSAPEMKKGNYWMTPNQPATLIPLSPLLNDSEVGYRGNLQLNMIHTGIQQNASNGPMVGMNLPYGAQNQALQQNQPHENIQHGQQLQQQQQQQNQPLPSFDQLPNSPSSNGLYYSSMPPLQAGSLETTSQLSLMNPSSMLKRSDATN